MPRTHIAKRQLRFPLNSLNRDALYAKLADFDTSFDTYVATGTGLLQPNCLSADSNGQALMATGYFTEAVATSKFVAQAITGALIKNATITATQLAPSILDGTQVKVGAPANTVGIIDESFFITVTNGSTIQTGQTLDATYGKIVVDDVYFIKGPTTGSTNDIVQLFADSNCTTSPVSSALALSGVLEGGVVRTTSLLNTAFAAGAIFYVKRTQTTNNAGTMVIVAHRVA
jgi:hypothetical protein